MAATVCFLAAAAAILQYVHYKNSKGMKKIELKLGTRKSALAMVQTNAAKQMLEKGEPSLQVEIVQPIQSYGDTVLDQSLKTLATQTPGLFTKDLEEGLLKGLYDVAVHSLKDVPTTLPKGLVIAAITEREDPRDVLG